jgi:hypothetical protein
MVALILAAILSQFASPDPDGLEKVAATLGIGGTAAPEPVISSPLPDYTVPALGNGGLSTSLAGIIGVLVCFMLPFGFYFWRKK